ncbi:MAG: polysaccharide pyruvyl transferase family protein [Paracoccaceae bacterium]|nr:polysaccharide pyruvyl transferase family protein [Paracoccaceae bacterium]
MDIFHYPMEGGNFGDDLNLWLWDDLLPGCRDWAPGSHLLGVGTILNAGLAPTGPKLVLGAGSGYGNLPDVAGPDWDIRAVRGPGTAARLGLPQALAVADGAVLLPRLERFSDIETTGETLFVPHWGSDLMVDWAAVAGAEGIAYQSPSADAAAVVRRIAGAKRVIAESMHAAIIADAFGVPWRAVAINRGFNMFKWRDWAASLGHDLAAPQRFFALPRRLQGLAEALRGRRAGGAGADGGPGGGQDGGHGVARPGRTGWLAPFARADLARARRGRFHLTDRDRLADAQARFLGVLDTVARDYP